MQYDYYSPPRIAFGWGRRRELAKLALDFGRRAFLVTGSKTLAANGTIQSLCDQLAAAGVEPIVAATIDHEPETADVDGGVANLKAQAAGEGDLVIAIGGGAALDLGKAIAALATQAGESITVRDYLEGVGRGLGIVALPLPVIALPTTGGTGSEATKNAVISSYDPPFKKSLRSDRMIPRAVLVDPELSVSVPPTTTAYTGLDCITQLIESYISKRSAPIPRGIALEGLRAANPMLERAVADGGDRAAREAMAHAALLSGLALANSGLGLAHGVAAALGSVCRVPHGLACAVMLPVALRFNREVCATALAELAAVVTGRHYTDEAAAAEATIAAIDALAARLDIPRQLGAIGVTGHDIPALVAGSHGNSLSGNPRAISDGELELLLKEML